MSWLISREFPTRQDKKWCLVPSRLKNLNCMKVSSCLEFRFQRTQKSCLVLRASFQSWFVSNVLCIISLNVLTCLEWIPRIFPCLVLSRLEDFLSRPIPALGDIRGTLGHLRGTLADQKEIFGGHPRHFGAPTGHFGGPKGDLWGTSKALLGTSGALWGTYGGTLGHLWGTSGDL